jgi:contractile injection system tape measure protein/pentapeptide repeat protein
MKSRFFIGTSFILCLLSLILFSCSSHDSNESDTCERLKPFAIDEHDLADNPDLVITSDHVVIIHLEPPSGISPHENDTATAGIDRIPIFFPEDVTHDFIVEYQGDEAFVVKLYNPNGNQVALLDKNSPTSTLEISAGEYTLEILHGGEVEATRTLFVRSGSTYVGRDCPGCFLEDVDLPNADLSGVDLSGADLSYADLSGADLTGADLTGTDLTGADLVGATFSVSNAGLVIAQVFFEPLFERLGLLNDGEFRSEAEKQKAVHFLQYLATGEKISNENDLILNKVLCGYPINEPVETTIDFEESETELIDSLIKAMISNWPAIQYSSIAAVRETFLVRDGTLAEKEDRWELRIKRKTFDILVDQIPWSFSVISFKWMNKPIYVIW